MSNIFMGENNNNSALIHSKWSFNFRVFIGGNVSRGPQSIGNLGGKYTCSITRIEVILSLKPLNLAGRRKPSSEHLKNE